MKDLNIVFVNYYGKEDLVKSVRSIFDDLKNSNLDVQVTVVDNSQNKDGVKQEVKAISEFIKYIDSGKNIGFGKANNLGFKETKARYYCALNGDTFIPKDKNTIGKIIKFLDENPKIGCVGPKLLNIDGTIQKSCYRFDKKSILIKPFKHINWDKKYKWVKCHADKLTMEDFDHNETRPVDWVLGAAIFVRGRVAEKTSFFDERYFMYLEDCDWCLRMWEEGIPVYYFHEAEIYHGHERESAKVPGIFKALFKNRLARIHLASWIKYVWKWRKVYKFYN